MAKAIQNPSQRLYATTIVDLFDSFQCKYALGMAFGQIIFKKSMLVQHKRNENKGLFFIQGEDEEMLAELVYTFREPDTLLLEHTEVDEELRGQNVGYQLVQGAVLYAREHHLKIIPLCSFARAIIERKPDFSDILAK